MSGPYGVPETLWLWELLNRKWPRGSPVRPTDAQVIALIDELDEFKAQQKKLSS